MSDNIPFEIQMDILQRIPDTKSVIQFRSVSKAWKSVIDSKDFVTAHTLRHTTHDHLFIRTRDPSDGQVKDVSIVDDETFPHQKVSVFVPDSVDKFSNNSMIVGSCHGLFCLYEDKTSTAVIWNPSIRKTVATKVPNVLRNLFYWTVVGFGICPGNLDPKLVKITYASHFRRLQHDVNTSTHVEVFTLSSGGTWRSPLSSNVPHKSIEFGSHQAVVDGFIYWNAVDRINVDGGFRKHILIMSFDLTSEELTNVNLPDSLALNHDAYMWLSNLRGSLAVLEFKRKICHVWQMIGHDCIRSFNKLYSIKAPDASIYRTLGFRKSGAPIIQVMNYSQIYHGNTTLAIYEPESKSITNIGIHGLDGSFSVNSYMETLLLLGHCDYSN